MNIKKEKLTKEMFTISPVCSRFTLSHTGIQTGGTKQTEMPTNSALGCNKQTAPGSTFSKENAAEPN